MILGIQDIEKEWDQASPILKRAIDRTDGKATVNSVYEDLRNKKLQLWKIQNLYFITQIDIYPKAKVCTLVYMAGELDKFLQEVKMNIESWARSEGCTLCEVQGRKGWERLLKDYKSEILLRKIL